MPCFKVFFEIPITVATNKFSVINELDKRFLKFTFNVENKSIDQSMISYFSNHGTRQRINNKKIGVGHSIWVLLCNFIEITPRHVCFPVNLLHNFRTPFLKGQIWKAASGLEERVILRLWNAYIQLSVIIYL